MTVSSDWHVLASWLVPAADISLLEEADLVVLDLGRIPLSENFHFSSRDYAIGMVDAHVLACSWRFSGTGQGAVGTA
jgi:hypothetical protein